ncbi:lipoyl(octanoyl) transferase LipB [Alistipes finegoldii]|uniref:lipoyl(octanoyl) transferase LipB n=1 Tax=Alistipes finegoldii TaxID=214856 RepID=UPI0026668329|nr:lipoyl(octanoyl) transferase LipB [Alistipes finegoldii]
MNVYCRDLGQMDYKACWDLQQSLFDVLTAGKTNRTAAPESATPSSEEAGTILLVEHPPVYTLGKSGHAENLLVGREALEAMGAQFFHIDRGGDITFHGPGQLVCYPILDLERLGIGLRAYIDALEESVIRTVAEYGIRAGRIAGASGVWVGAEIAQEGDGRTADGGGKCTPAGAPRKICAIGVRSSRYITMHGFALNVTTDLEWFSRINPCGFTDRGATSIERETGAKVPMDDVKRLVVKFLSEILNVRIYK